MQKIKVLQVVSKMGNGGIEKFLMNLYSHIDRNKVEFAFVVHTKEEQIYDKLILEYGGKILRVPRFKLYNIIGYIISWFKLFRENNDYKLMHCHMVSVASIYITISKFFNITSIVHSHSTRSDVGAIRYLKSAFQYPIRFLANYKFACSSEAGIALFGKRKSFTKIPNAINTEEYMFNQTIRDNYKTLFNLKDKFIIGHVGRINPTKRQDFIIDIMDYIVNKKKIYDYHFVSVGNGSLIDKLITKVERLNLNNHVTFLGYRDDISNIMQMFDMIIFPSLYEGFPVTLIESQCSGLNALISSHLTRDVNLTSLIKRVDIEEKAAVWGNEALKLKMTNNRENYYEIVKSKGFDIKQLADILARFYTDKELPTYDF